MGAMIVAAVAVAVGLAAGWVSCLVRGLPLAVWCPRCGFRTGIDSAGTAGGCMLCPMCGTGMVIIKKERRG